VEGLVGQQPDAGLRHRLGGADIAEEAGLSVVDHLRKPPARRHHGRAARHRLERREAERLGLGREQEEVGAGEQLLDRLCLPRKSTSSRRPSSAARLQCPRPLGTVADEDQARLAPSSAMLPKTLDDVLDALDGPEVRDVHDDLLAARRELARWQGSLSGRHTSVSTKFGITSMRPPGTEKSRTVSSRRNCDTAVSPSDCRIEKRVIAWNDGCSPTSVMSVPCSVVTILQGRSAGEHLAREVGRRGVRDRVVHVHQVQPVLARRVVERDRERQRVRRVLEERVVLHLDFVEVHPLVQPPSRNGWA
jgi:hypothetical protein